MEEELALLQMRNDELWDLLEDPTLPPLDRQTLNEEMYINRNRIMELECQLLEVEVVSFGPDEYDREGLIVYAGFDFAGEI